MMGAAEPISLKQSVGVSDEIAVSEKELFNQGRTLARRRGAVAKARTRF